MIGATLEVDMGAHYTIITYNDLWPGDQVPELRPIMEKLRTYTVELLKMLGSAI